MKLIGEAVIHKSFGCGYITEYINGYIIVHFDKLGESKRFEFPTSIGLYLELENKDLTGIIDETKKYLADKEALETSLREEKRKQLKFNKETMRYNKSVTGNNIAFKCNYCDGGSSKDHIGFVSACSDEMIDYNILKEKHIWCSAEDSECLKYLQDKISRKELDNACKTGGYVCYESQMLRDWRAYAGITQTGKNKGQPMTLRQVKANSLAILTTRFPYSEESERVVFAVFLVDEKYEGDNRAEGYVSANPQYSIALTKDEAQEIKFWNYYYNHNKPEKIKLGSGLHRYLSDIQALQILKDICHVVKSDDKKMISAKFLEHYCRIKGIDKSDIPKPQGALLSELIMK